MPIETSPIAAGLSVVSLGLTACTVSGVQPAPAELIPTRSMEEQMSDLKRIRRSILEAPPLAIPHEWTTTVDRKVKEKTVSERIIKPEIFQNKFPINITCSEAVPGRTTNDRLKFSSDISLYVRDNGELLNEYFGFLWQEPTDINEMHILKSLDIVILSLPYVCQPRVLDPGRAVVNDWLDWTDNRLTNFISLIEQNRNNIKEIPQFRLPRDPYSRTYDSFGGQDLNLDLARLKIYHDQYNTNNRNKLFNAVDTGVCEKTTPYGITLGLTPAFKTYQDGILVRDKAGIPIVELKARVYCVIAERPFVPFGATIIHETNHTERLLEGVPVGAIGQSDEHIYDPAYPGTTFTSKSLQYTQYADTHPENLLFLHKSSNRGNILGMSEHTLPISTVAAAVLNPTGFIGGLVSLGLGNVFYRRSVSDDGSINSRAKFLSDMFSGSGLLFTGSSMDIQSSGISVGKYYQV